MFSKFRSYVLLVIIYSIVTILSILSIDFFTKDYFIPLIAAISALIALHGIINQYNINEKNNAQKITNNKKIIRTYFNILNNTLNEEIKTLNEMLIYSQNIFDKPTTFIKRKTIIYNKINEYTNTLLDKELYVELDSETVKELSFNIYKYSTKKHIKIIILKILKCYNILYFKGDLWVYINKD